MSDNPYAASNAMQTEFQSPATHDTAPFFAVSQLKLLVLSLCTLGFYEVVWFYRNWKLIKERDGSDIKPVLRAVFAILFCYQCFARMRETGDRNGIGSAPAIGALTAGWIIASLAWKLPEPYNLISLCAVFFLLPMQAYANRINAAVAPMADTNSRFSAWNWVVVVLGGIVLVLGIIGSFISPTAAPV